MLLVVRTEGGQPVRGMVKIIIRPDEPSVACSLHSGGDSVGLPRTVLGLTGSDESDAVRGVLLFSDGVVLDVVDDQEFIVVLESGGQLPTGVGPACYWQEDIHRWTTALLRRQ